MYATSEYYEEATFDLALTTEVVSGGNNGNYFVLKTPATGGRDTDGDNMPDAWEVAHGLSINMDDADDDADLDTYTNLEEYELQSDPQDNTDPLREVYVSTTGVDDPERGTAAQPFRHIQYAMEQVADYALPNRRVTVNVAAGTYDEKVVMSPHVALKGAGRFPGAAVTTIQFFDAVAPDHTVVTAADDTSIEALAITLPATQTAVTGVVAGAYR